MWQTGQPSALQVLYRRAALYPLTGGSIVRLLASRCVPTLRRAAATQDWSKQKNVATKIKLMRLGMKRAPYYRIVVADARTKRDGRVIETIGKYHPKEDPSFIEVNSDRALYWLGVGAQPTDPVAAILKVTGDWQKFKGLPAPPPMLVKAPKVDKAETFAAAARASAGITDVTAPLTPKQAKKAAPPAAEAPAAEAPAVETPAEPAAEAQAPAAEAADEPSAE
jgi:small subunit ribosomal protein S16